MDFLRRHLFLIICTLSCVAGIALGVTGIRAMAKVEEQMKGPSGLYQSLSGLRSAGISRAAIDAQHERIELVLADRDKVFESAEELAKHEPLVKDVFPEGKPLELLDFRRRYGTEMNRLFDSLRSGLPPGPREIDAMNILIEEEQSELRESGEGLPDEFTGPSQTPAGVLTKAGAKLNAEARASIAAAQRVYCYGVPFKEERLPDRPASFEFEPAMADVDSAEPPYLSDAWRAQVGYWIQKDVVDVIVAMNSEVANAALEQKGKAWVGIMPVRDVISVRVSLEYIMTDSEANPPALPGGYQAAYPPGGPDGVFTGRASGPDYEVRQFTVKLVMDQRRIPDFVRRLTSRSFYTLLGVAYTSVPPNRRMVGKIYGEGPVVTVVMDFEALMLAEVYRKWMPQEVCEYYGFSCPQPEGAEGD